MKYTYSESAQLRIAEQGIAAITAFIEELSPVAQSKILVTRPPIPGFRKSGPALVKKQRELLAAAIGHLPNDNHRTKPLDWMAFGAIWSFWGHQKFSDAFPSGPFDFADISSEEALDFVRDIVGKCNSGCAREDVDRLVLFSGLPSTDSLSAFIARLPLRATLERDRALANLPAEVGTLRHQTKEIERNVGKLTDELTNRLDGLEKFVRSAEKSAETTAVLEKNFADFERRVFASLSKEISAVAEKVSFFSKQVDVLRKDYEDAGRTFDAELSKKQQAFHKLVTTLAAEVVDVRSALDAVVERQQDLADSLKPRDIAEFSTTTDDRTSVSFEEKNPRHYPPTWINFGSAKTVKEMAKIESLFQLTQENVIAAGVRRSDSDHVARALASAIISGQLLQCCGSLADVLGRTAAASCGGDKVLAWQVPLGLNSTVEADGVQRVAEVGAAGALVLRGINRSAFEIYGGSVRDTVVCRHLQREYGGESLALIATYAEGPATLPLSASLVELGPLLDTDILSWGGSADWQSIEIGKWALGQQHFRSPLSVRDEIDEIHRIVDILKISPTKLWRIVFSRFVDVLFLLPSASFENSLSVALLTWVLPLAKAKGLTRERVENAVHACAIEQLSVAHVRNAIDDLSPEGDA